MSGFSTKHELAGGRVGVPRFFGVYQIQLGLDLALARRALFPTSEVSAELPDDCIQWRREWPRHEQTIHLHKIISVSPTNMGFCAPIST
jgi:hypothetical protein